MRLVTAIDSTGPIAGVALRRDSDRIVVPAGAAATAAGLDAASCNSVRRMIEAGYLRCPFTDRLVEAADHLVDLGDGRNNPALLAPVPDPDKILCFGVNYREHADEADLEPPIAPMLFAKFRNSLIGDGSPVIKPWATKQLDYEGELAVIMGASCKNVRAEDALNYVAGAMVFNDITARDLQLQVSQWTTGKAADTFAPCGPELVSLDEIGSLDALTLTTRVNERTVQQASTGDMIFAVPHLIEFLSRTMTLLPGDIIATGTPAGVGFKRTPPLLLEDGDVVEVSIDRIGTLRNPIVDGTGSTELVGAVDIAEQGA